MTIRGVGNPIISHDVQMPNKRMGPPPTSLAHDANDCIMVGLTREATEYKAVRGLAPRCDGGLAL